LYYFDYEAVAREAKIPADKLKLLAKAAREEFPTDDMYELPAHPSYWEQIRLGYSRARISIFKGSVAIAQERIARWWNLISKQFTVDEHALILFSVFCENQNIESFGELNNAYPRFSGHSLLRLS